ncbi:MAG: hypothetical protein V1702_00330 [Candidatus Woesearchaeota archaeon]
MSLTAKCLFVLILSLLSLSFTGCITEPSTNQEVQSLPAIAAQQTTMPDTITPQSENTYTPKQAPSANLGNIKFTLEQIGKSYCYGKIEETLMASSFGDSFFGFRNSYSSYFVQNLRTETINQDEQYGFRLMYDSNPAIMNSCLMLKVNGNEFCTSCVEDSNYPECLIDLDEQEEMCNEDCNQQFSTETCNQRCTFDNIKSAIQKQTEKKANFTIMPECIEANMTLSNGGTNSQELYYGDAVIITDSGKQYSSLKVCDGLTREEIYPNTIKKTRYCFESIDEDGVFYIKVNDASGVKQLSFPYSLS